VTGFGFETSACAHCGHAITVVPFGRVDVCSHCGSSPDAEVVEAVAASVAARLATEPLADSVLADARGMERPDDTTSTGEAPNGGEAARAGLYTEHEMPSGPTTPGDVLTHFGKRDDADEGGGGQKGKRR
jgi:hypothetical protein